MKTRSGVAARNKPESATEPKAATPKAEPRAMKDVTRVEEVIVEVSRFSEHNSTTRYQAADKDAGIRDVYLRHEMLDALGRPDTVQLCVRAAGPKA